LSFVLVFLVLLFLGTCARAYETNVRCLFRVADHVVKHLVDYLLFRLLFAARRVVEFALRVTGEVNGRNLTTEQRPPAW
jgi:hypothetical protein